MTSDSVSNGQTEPDPDTGSGSNGETALPSTADVERNLSARRTRRRWWAVAAFAVIVTGVVAAAFLIRLPYYVVSPGSVRPSESRVSISGADSYTSPGSVMFTTVYIDQATPALLLRAWLDDSFEVHSREEMYPDGDRKESQAENVALMDNSKVVAAKVALDEVGIPAKFATDGVQVVNLVKGSPSKGVLKPGDVITEVDGGEVSVNDDIFAELKDRRPGDTVSVVVDRPNRSDPKRATEKHLEVTLGAAGKGAEDPMRPVLGITVQEFGLRVDSKVEVKVDSGDVTGPSAGLAWTLAIIDRLTPGSLTSKRDIAVTGEIRPDGSVGQIGGIQQKIAAVKRAGVKVFIYPSETSRADQEAVKRIAGGSVSLYPVDNVAQAVEILEQDGHS